MTLFPILTLLVGQQANWGPPPPVAPYSTNLLPAQQVVLPITFPVLGPSRWKNGYGDMRSGFRHTGIDIRAPKMTPIVAPFSGTLGMKRNTFWIYGDNGWRTLGTHLNDDTPGTKDNRGTPDFMFAPDIYPNCHVHEGQFLGYVGDSGDATAPHLHFEIYAPGSGPTAPNIRNPYPSLLKARVLSRPIEQLPQMESRPFRDEMRLQGCVRSVDPTKGTVSIILTAKLFATGDAIRVTTPRYVRLRTTDAPTLRLLQRLSDNQTVGFVVPAKGPLADATIRRLLL